MSNHTERRLRCYLFMKNMVTCVVISCKMQQFLTGSYWNWHGYTLVTCMLLIQALLHLFYAAFHEVPRETDFDKNAGVLFGRCYFLLHSWVSICQMVIGLLFNTGACINNVNIQLNIDMGFVCFVRIGSVWIFVQFHYVIAS